MIWVIALVVFLLVFFGLCRLFIWWLTHAPVDGVILKPIRKDPKQ